MPKYNHQCALAFTVISENFYGEDITSDMVKAALQKRIEDLDSAGELEWKEALAIEDTYKEDEPHA